MKKQILDALEPNLSSSEKKALKEEILASEEKEEFLFYEKLVGVIKEDGKKDLRKELDEFLDEHTIEKGSKGLFRNYKSGLAAIITLAIVGFISILFNSHSTSPQVLYEHYYEPFPMSYFHNTRGGDSPRSQFSLESDTAIFYTAMKLLDRKEIQMSIDYLRGVHDRSIFFQDATWYLSLALILNDQVEESKVELVRLDSTSIYYDRSVRLLEDLE